MKNKISQIIKIALLILIILSNFNIKVYAIDPDEVIEKEKEKDAVGNIITQGEDFIRKGEAAFKNDKIIDEKELKELNSKIFNILLAIGVVTAVIIGAILGIQLMWGSIEQQVKAKEMLMAYGIGCIVVFGAFGIWKICIIVFSQL